VGRWTEWSLVDHGTRVPKEGVSGACSEVWCPGRCSAHCSLVLHLFATMYAATSQLLLAANVLFVSAASRLTARAWLQQEALPSKQLCPCAILLQCSR
jgi:hypothetical protein